MKISMNVNGKDYIARGNTIPQAVWNLLGVLRAQWKRERDKSFLSAYNHLYAKYMSN